LSVYYNATWRREGPWRFDRLETLLRRLIIALAALVATLAAGANDPWAKVRDLKTGTELRVFKKGSTKPVMATLDEASDDNLIVVVKNEEIAIPREDIDRIDYRPPQTDSRTTKETRTVEKPPEGGPPNPRSQGDMPSTETTSGVSFGGKPDFQTVYRRPPPGVVLKK